MVPAGQTTQVLMEFTNGDTQAEFYPVVADLLDPSLEYIPNSEFTHGNWPEQYLPWDARQVEIIENFEGTGRTLVRISWPDQYSVPGNSPKFIFGFDVKVKSSTRPSQEMKDYKPEGLYSNTVYIADRKNPATAGDQCVRTFNVFATPREDTGNLLGLDVPHVFACTDTDHYEVGPSASLESKKYVKGSEDSDFRLSPEFGNVLPEKPAEFKLEIVNSGNIDLDKVIVYDVLPFIGDPGVRVHENNRDSSYRPLMTGPVRFDPETPEADVRYSLSSNPCRGEVVTSGAQRASAPDGCNDSWVAEPEVTDWSKVRAVRVDFGDTVLEPEKVWNLLIDVNAPEKSARRVAWNSFAVAARDRSLDQFLLPVEPAKVGLLVPGELELVKSHHIVDDAGAKLPNGKYQPGATVEYLIKVTNNGPGDLTETAVADTLPMGLTWDTSFQEASNGSFDFDTGIWTLNDQVSFPVLDFEGNEVRDVEGNVVTEMREKGLPRDASATLKLRATVDEATEGQELCNHVKADALEAREAVEAQDCFIVGVEIGELVWYDTDANGQFDEGEQGLPNVTVILKDSAGTEIERAVTDENGRYKFTGIQPAGYTVEIDRDSLPQKDSPWIDTHDVDGTPDGNATITLDRQNRTDVNFGLTQPVSIGDFVWLDENFNGIQNDGELGIGGVSVDLYQGNKLVDRVTTNDDGRYLFEGRLPGSDYRVKFGLPGGYNLAPVRAGEDHTINSKGLVVEMV
ncbi:putative repeat protein (TIGR01451 family) [Trueperella bonasi]|uniref:Repeat protein (TIGR01451 family) n=1 Tax=Trueperella bonasi TaxID=312286 RepID=A0ABT9NHA3_9ACTO|nr:SdrD B-like domain-containing protein [Trueperella bonasi]MDP9806383.1 putative repeat protein (TIGR01451 family) [Trueperella bonasi]